MNSSIKSPWVTHERQHSRMEGGCEYNKQIVADGLRGFLYHLFIGITILHHTMRVIRTL